MICLENNTSVASSSSKGQVSRGAQRIGITTSDAYDEIVRSTIVEQKFYKLPMSDECERVESASHKQHAIVSKVAVVKRSTNANRSSFVDQNHRY